jgi:molecular chaperone GrpE
MRRMDPEPRAHGSGPGVESPGTGPAADPAPDVTEAPPERPHGDPLREDAIPSEGEPRVPQREHQPTPDPNAPAAPQPAGDPEAPTGPAPAASQPGSAPGGSPGVSATQPAGDPQAHEAKVTQDLEELTAKAEKADEYLELAQRTKADFENYRRRATREAALAQERGVAKLAKELLPAVDNLDRALEAVEAQALAQGDPRGAGDPGAANGDSQLLSGIKLVHADVIAALQRSGIERFEPKGEQFDPQQHEAVAQQPVEGAAPGTIVEVYQRGYRIGESVLRPARVVVAQ